MALTEQEILANTLKSQAEGGSAMAGGALGAGADVPTVLAENPATRQLLEESIRIQSGRNSRSVVTSEAAAKQTEDNQAKLAELTTPTATGTTTTVTPTATGTTTTETTLDPQAQEYSNWLGAQLSSYESQLDSYATRLDENLQATVDSIKATYARRKDQMALTNANALASQRILGSRSGRQRYASEVQSGILTAEEAAGIERLAALDAEEQNLIREATMANDASQFELLNTRMTQLTDLYDKKMQLIKDQQTMAYQNEQLLLQKSQEAREQARWEFEQASVESFFKGSDIVSIMKDLPAGETTTIVDPSSGATYVIEGIASESADLKQYMTTDNSGNVRIVNYDPNVTNTDGTKGAVVSIADAGKLGKSGGAGTTVILNQQQQAGLDAALSALEATKGPDGKYDTGEVVRQYQTYTANNPGKAQQFKDLVLPNVNTSDVEIQTIINGSIPESDVTLDQLEALLGSQMENLPNE